MSKSYNIRKWFYFTFISFLVMGGWGSVTLICQKLLQTLVIFLFAKQFYILFILLIIRCTCISGRYKIIFIRLPHSQLIVNPVHCMPVRLGFGNPAGTFYKYRVDYLFPASPPHSTVWYKERAINTELRQKVLQYSVLLSHGSVMAQLFSPHH